MNQQLLQYIDFARKRKVADADIRANLVAAAWDPDQIDAALKADDAAKLVPPPPPVPASIVSPAASPAASGMAPGSIIGSPGGAPAAPIAVVQQRTTKGLEYTIMFVALGATAVSLGALLHDMVDSSFGGQGSTDVVSFAASALIVALPIFAILFLRLKRAELTNPSIRSDASRRHAVQLTLVVSFVWGLFRLITYIYSLLNGGSGGDGFSLGSDNSSPVANVLHTLITLAIAGGIFAYYWHDEHRKDQA